MALQGTLSDAQALNLPRLDLLDGALSAAWLQSTVDIAVLPTDGSELPQRSSCVVPRAPPCNCFDAHAYLHWMKVYSCEGELDVSLALQRQRSAAHAIQQLRCRL